MTTRVAAGSVQLALVAVVAGCAGHGADDRPWHEDSIPPMAIALPDSIAGRVDLDSARWVNAPPVRFAAITQPDPDHTVPVIVPGSDEVRLASIRPGGTIQRGDTLALLRPLAGRAAAMPLLATSAEVWWPRRRAGEMLLPGDTVGEIQHPGRFIAVGQVETVEAATLEPGDNAVISLPGRPPLSVHGRVAAITTAKYRVEVAVHFHRSDSAPDVGGLTQVSIFPSGARGRVLVVPQTSIVALPQGPALFVPRGRGVFDVRFVASDEHEGGVRVVHQGLSGPAAIAVGNLATLVSVAEDSFQVRTRKRP